MALIDFILNIACLLLWLNWLSIRFDPLARTSAASLVGTLRKTEQAGLKHWKFLGSLLALLLVRALAYGQMGSATGWTPSLDLGIVTLSFRSDYSDYLARMFLFSLLSFASTLAVFYLWMLLLSVVNNRIPDADPLQKLVRLYCKWVDRWPQWLKALLPFAVGGLFWLTLHPLLARLAIVPGNKSTAQLFEQSATIGLGAYLALKYLIVGILFLHLLNSYVFMGHHPAWNFVNTTARNLLSPLSWLPLRIGKVDFLPVAAIALVFFVTELLTNPSAWPSGLRPWYYHLLPF
jgi:uncharacterized protein YggT (Ycf19 family)